MQYIKDPDSTLDYKFDWAPLENGVDGETTNWLDRTSSPVETIQSHTITITPGESPGLNVNGSPSSSITDGGTTVTVWLIAGQPGQSYRVTCNIVTSVGRADERSMRVAVTER